MLRNELKPLLGEGWKEKFVHRDLWDPDGYGVASFDLGEDREKVLVINFATNDIMEYFYDDLPDDEWISLDRAIKLLYGAELKNSANINKRYSIDRVQNTSSKSDLTRKTGTSHTKYPRISLVLAPNNKTTILLHRMIATVFVPNPRPSEFSIINHIDKNKENFNKENLEWCSTKWNAQKENQLDPQLNKSYVRESDNSKFSINELARMYKIKPSSVRTNIDRSIRNNTTYREETWRVVDLTLEDYLLKHPLEDNWFSHPTISGVRANSCGVLEIDGKLRIGHQTEAHYYAIRNKNRSYLTHRALEECYLGRELDPEETVDHINPVTEQDCDNCIRNLRVGTKRDNMNNDLTKQKFQVRTDVYDLFGEFIASYSSRKDAFLETGCSCLNNGIMVDKGLIIIDKGEDVERITQFIYYKFDSSANLIDANAYLGKLSKTEGTTSYAKIKRYVNTGMVAPDGFLYQQGFPNTPIVDLSNKQLIKKRPDIGWRNRYKNREDD